MLVPIFQEHGTTYEADTCWPLVQAVEGGRLRLHALARGHYPGGRLPRGALPGVKTVGFWDASQPQDWGLDWHRNEGIELTFLESGAVGFGVDDQGFQLQAGDLAVTRPWQRHRVGDPQVGAGRLHWLILDVGVRRPHQTWRWPAWVVLTPADLRQLTAIFRHNEQPVWHVTADLSRCFHRIGAAVESDCNGSSLSRLAVELNQLFLLVLEMFRRQEIRLDQSLASTRHTVELFWADLRENCEHLALEWTVRGMARRCGMGATNFIGQTKQLTNMTPMQYLNHCRLTAAAELLRAQPARNITDIALACGFSSSQYFATLFRNRFRQTPREFRVGS
jgi:AraC family transcriptional regulator, 4-hydroxyphenylacetate 3-monooxygenase operon regulatory protein